MFWIRLVVPLCLGVCLSAQEKLEVQRFEVQVGEPGRTFLENAYLAVRGKEALLIDPGAIDGKITAWIKERNLKVQAILITHGHWDHVGGAVHFAKTFGAPVYAHPADRPGKGFRSLKAGSLTLGSFEVQVLETPGHSPGSVCFLIQGHLFSGDTLFEGGVGRTFGRTPLENEQLASQVIVSIRTQLLTRPESTPVYPGHGAATTLGQEKRNNPFLQ